MIKKSSLRVSKIAALAGVFILPLLARALDATAWQHGQEVVVTQAGANRIALPPATFGACQAQLQDLRLLSPEGAEVPYFLDVGAPPPPAATARPAALDVALKGAQTEITLVTGTTAPLESVTLSTPAPAFLKPARVERATTDGGWEIVADGAPLFRQYGAEQMTLDLKRQRADRLRLTIDDSRSRPLPITGATLQLARAATTRPTTIVPTARLAQREEFAGETVLTVDLGASHLPLTAFEIASPDPVFTRRLTFLTREVRDETAVEQTLASGTIFRLSLDGIEPTARLSVPVEFTAPARELIVRIANGDSPPLKIDGITVRQRPVWVVFSAAKTGVYQLLSGNATASAPRYDLAEFGPQLQTQTAREISPGPLAPNPRFQAKDDLENTVLIGASIDVADWRREKPVQVAAGGVQKLELDPEVLAGTANDGGDLRLVRDGKQVPYILERPSLARTLDLGVTPADQASSPRTSRWELRLANPGLPITKLTLRTTTAVFHRRIRVLEPARNDGMVHERVWADVEWQRGPGGADSLTLPLEARWTAPTLVVETDNGDNPPITLSAASVAYPVVRLLFKAPLGPLSLYYENENARAPRYDVAMIADQLVAAAKNQAVLGPEHPARAGRGSLAGLRAGWVFWGALGLVVVVLLFIVAKLLPKPPVS
jgi:hypothetical protein